MKYEIYQLKDSRNCYYGFMGWDFAKKHDFSMDDYRQVYSGTIIEDDNYKALNRLFEIFNIGHPADFCGHSMSVSDIIVLRNTEKSNVKVYYCDSFGFEDITAMVNISKRMTEKEMIEYLLEELKDEKYKMLRGEENKYSYIFMLCNDMGIIEGQ